MNTIVKKANPESIAEAAELLRAGEIVAIPTETVYGLAANALNPSATRKIFAAKGRPADNPLIVHVSDLNMARELGLEIPPLAEKLAKAFWNFDGSESLENTENTESTKSGALTMILSRTDFTIPSEVSCGLDTVAVRAPNHAVALEIIKLCGFPLAAPSANISGTPSPTKAEHVFADLKNKIPLIIDGGECLCGVESTVIKFEGEKIRILRPGVITAESLNDFAEVIIDDAVLKNHNGGKPLSPGTAHKHYSPKAQVIAVSAESAEAFLSYTRREEYVIAEPQARTFYAELREFDERGAEKICIRLPKPVGVGLALYNRIIRAANFRVIEIK